MDKKIYIIGFDGADQWLIDYWIKRGVMPNLHKIMGKSACGYSNSTIPPVTAPAWNSFLTGKDPGKHGIYDFMIEDKKTGEYYPAGSGHRKEQAIWHWIKKSGKKSIVLNIPTEYPPEETDGVIVSGFMTPSNKDDYVTPNSLRKEIEDKFGKYPLAYQTPCALMNLSTTGITKFLKECKHFVDYKFKVSEYLIDKFGPDLFFLHLFENDQISHAFWHFFDENHWYHDAKGRDKYIELIADYYRLFDQLLKKFYDKYINDDAYFFMMSDHGFTAWNRTIAMNTWLLKNGYMKIKRNPVSQIKYFFWKLGLTHESANNYLLKPLSKIPGFYIKDIPFRDRWKSFYKTNTILLTRKDIDPKRCTAICSMGFGQIAIKTKGVYKDGCVEPSKYEEVRDELIEKLKKIVDPKTNKVIEGDIYKREEIYKGDYVNDAPDITFLPMKSGYLATTLWGLSTNKTVTKSFSFTGTHRQLGICYLSGNGVKKSMHGYKIDLVDFLPTILYILGCSIPEDVDGKIRTDLFEESYCRGNKAEFCPPEKRVKETQGLDEREQEEIEKRLKGLGYL